MKAFLISDKLQPYHLDIFKELIGRPKVSKALFITAAAVPYGLELKPEWLKRSLNNMEQFAEKVDEISLEDKNDIPKDLSKYSFIYVSGGNVFYLAYRLSETGMDKKIKTYINKGGIYSGSSAGAIILMKSIEYFSTADNPKVVPNLYDGLGLIDYAIVPHIENKKYKQIMQDIADKYKEDRYETILLRDNQILVIDSESKEVF